MKRLTKYKKGDVVLILQDFETVIEKVEFGLDKNRPYYWFKDMNGILRWVDEEDITLLNLSGLTPKDMEIEKWVDKIKTEESTLICIGIMKEFLESQKIKFPPEKPSGWLDWETHKPI